MALAGQPALPSWATCLGSGKRGRPLVERQVIGVEVRKVEIDFSDAAVHWNPTSKKYGIVEAAS